MSAFYKIKTPAVNAPLRLIDVKNFLKVRNDSDDELINSLIVATTNQGEMYTGRDFEIKTYTGKYPYLSSVPKESLPFVSIKKARLISLNSVKAFKSGVFTDVPTKDYFLRENNRYSRVYFITPPIVDDNVPYSLELEFTAGYSTVPKDILLALKQHILFLYENRGDVIPAGNNTMPIVTKSIYSKYRILDVYG